MCSFPDGPSHPLISTEPIRYGHGTGTTRQNRNFDGRLRASYGYCKYLSSMRAFYSYYNASGHSGRIFTHPRPSRQLTPLPYPHLRHPPLALSPAPNAKQRGFSTSSHPSTLEWASILTLQHKMVCTLAPSTLKDTVHAVVPLLNLPTLTFSHRACSHQRRTDQERLRLLRTVAVTLP
jgi:hypothetical protein